MKMFWATGVSGICNTSTGENKCTSITEEETNIALTIRGCITKHSESCQKNLGAAITKSWWRKAKKISFPKGISVAGCGFGTNKMSFEGYIEFLCENGHRFSIDALDTSERKCDWCGALPALKPDGKVWCNLVDNTNCYSEGEIPDVAWKQFLIDPGDDKTEPRYRMPTEEEHKKMQAYWNGKQWIWFWNKQPVAEE